MFSRAICSSDLFSTYKRIVNDWAAVAKYGKISKIERKGEPVC